MITISRKELVELARLINAKPVKSKEQAEELSQKCYFIAKAAGKYRKIGIIVSADDQLYWSVDAKILQGFCL